MLCAVCGFLVAGSACTTDSEPQLPDSRTSQVSLLFRAEGTVAGRTVLPPNEDGFLQGMQHVTDVHLYIYDGMTDDAPCIAVEDVGWWDYFGGADGLPSHTDEMRYVLKTRLAEGRTYTLLAVGLDNRDFAANGDWDGTTSGATYALPQSVTVGSRLGDAVARLAGGKGAGDIARSELFAGSLRVTPVSSTHLADEPLVLHRRVAGIQAYFADLPKEIVRVRVLLYRSQNTAVPLLARSKDPVFMDYVDAPFGGDAGNYEGRVVFDFPIEQTDKRIGGGGVDPEPPFVENEIMIMAGGTSFLLPMPAPTDADYTLMVEFIPEGATGIVGDVRRVKLAVGPDGTLVYDTELGTGIIDDPSLYRYPIVANQFYCLGTPREPIGYPSEKN